MSSDKIKKSLLDGRNVNPLSQHEVTRAANTFLGLDNTVNARYEERSYTRFVENGEESEIVFSDDIYPGTSVINPNAGLSLKGAAAHELAHHYRWIDKAELSHGHLTHIDEAMTSLEAALRYAKELSDTDIQGLISDSLHRLKLFVAEETKKKV